MGLKGKVADRKIPRNLIETVQRSGGSSKAGIGLAVFSCVRHVIFSETHLPDLITSIKQTKKLVFSS